MCVPSGDQRGRRLRESETATLRRDEPSVAATTISSRTNPGRPPVAAVEYASQRASGERSTQTMEFEVRIDGEGSSFAAGRPASSVTRYTESNSTEATATIS